MSVFEASPKKRRKTCTASSVQHGRNGNIHTSENFQCTNVTSGNMQSSESNSSQISRQQEEEQQQPNISSDRENRRCPYCFISPCVAYANRSAQWIGFGQQANVGNSTIRKRIYRRFWKIMANNKGWNIPEYIEKKIRIGGGNWVLTHRRELMPECVVSLARQLYPNPKDIPYMDHMWE